MHYFAQISRSQEFLPDSSKHVSRNSGLDFQSTHSAVYFQRCSHTAALPENTALKKQLWRTVRVSLLTKPVAPHYPSLSYDVLGSVSEIQYH